MKHFILGPLVLLLSACAAQSVAPSRTSPAHEGPGTRASAQIAQAAVTPLSDLNLVYDEVPAALAAAKLGPYHPPADPGCPALAAEIAALDVALGADLDEPPAGTKPGPIQRGVGALGDAALGTARAVAEGVFPFRHWVRKLSGAERRSRNMAAATAAGTVRRAFLKGIAQSKGCAARTKPTLDITRAEGRMDGTTHR